MLENVYGWQHGSRNEQSVREICIFPVLADGAMTICVLNRISRTVSRASRGLHETLGRTMGLEEIALFTKYFGILHLFLRVEI